MIKSHVNKELGNDLICRGQFYVWPDKLELNDKPTLGFGYATLDGKHQFIVIALERINAREEITKRYGSVPMCALSILYISDDGKSYRRGVLLPHITFGLEFIFTLVIEHLPNRELIERLFSSGFQEEIKGLDLDQIEREFLMLLGKDRVDSGQDFETSRDDLSAFQKMVESAVAAAISKAKPEFIQEVTKSQKAVAKAVTSWHSPKTVTTQETRACFYGVSVQTIKRWEKPPFQGKPPDYNREASAEDLEKAGETYKSYKRGNMYSRANRKRKSMD